MRHNAIRSSTRTKTGVVKHRSNTEKEFYHLLKGLGEPFEYEKRINLTGPSVHKTGKIRLLRDRGADQVYMDVDFYFERDGVKHFVDTKGVKATVESNSILKYRLLKHKLLEEGEGNISEIRFVYMKDVQRLLKYAKYAPEAFWQEFYKIKLF